jgi:hypothetical protein
VLSFGNLAAWHPFNPNTNTMNTEPIEYRSIAHCSLRGLCNGKTDEAERLGRYLAADGPIHWRNAMLAVEELDPDRPEFEDCRELVAAIRCALANADRSGLRYFFG